MKKNTASQVIAAQLVSATDGSAVTSGTTDVYVTGNGGTQASTGTATHEGNGCWSYLPSQAETNYDHIAFTFVNASAINATVQVYTSYPQTGDSFTRLGAPAGASIAADIDAVPTAAENADKKLGRNIMGGSDGGRTESEALCFLRNKVDAENGFVYETDDTTVAWSFTSTTNPLAQPITVIDPA